MALVLHNTMDRPLGQFDSLDAQVSLWKGGEIACWATTPYGASATDKAAADVLDDGYAPVGGTPVRPVVTIASTNSSAGAGAPPLFLADDGTNHYGTLFGVVVGATAGQTSFGPGGGTNLGPNTATGSGKVTLWHMAGLYGVTLDAVDSTSGTGLVTNNTGLTVGTPLQYTSLGLLTPATTLTTKVGYFSEFQTTGSFVTSQQFMVAALNSPSGDVTSLQQQSFYQAVFYFLGSAAIV